MRVGALIFGVTLLIGLVLTVVAVVRRVRRQQPGGFQAFDLALIIGIALIVGSFIGLQRGL